MIGLRYVLCGLALLQLAAAIDLYSGLARVNPEKNIVYSPFSADSALTLAFMGARGKTAEELRTALKLGTGDKTQVASNYRNVLQSIKPEHRDSPKLKIANRIFVDNKYSLAPTYNEIVGTYFDAEAEGINFEDGLAAAERINSWVAKQTEDNIKDIISADSFDSSTMAAILNAVYFKGFWKEPFNDDYTKKQDFNVNAREKVSIDMMHQEKGFEYAELNDLNAKVVQLPYYMSELSMWIILPNEFEGLATVQSKLSTYDWKAVQFRKELVELQLPKFKFEFGADLIPYLKEMGIKDLFSKECNLSELLVGEPGARVSNVKQKAFIEVHEKGTEAAGATVMVLQQLRGMAYANPPKQFFVDRPFVFAIRDGKTTYFAGQVVHF